MAHSSHTKSNVSIDLFNLPPLPDMRKHSTMICEMPNNLFVPDGKNTQLSKVVNTWTFDRLTPNGNEGVRVQLDYLEHAYGTRYYVIDKINGDINAIHDQSLELTEFKGHFSPFDLDDLEARVCRLANRPRDVEDAVGQQNAPCTHFTDPRTLNMETYEGMGFDENNYSLIPTVSGESSKRITPRPTSTLKPEDELVLNRSDPTDNRGKVNRINSFEITQDRATTLLKISKGGPIKNLGTKIQSRQGTSNQT